MPVLNCVLGIFATIVLPAMAISQSAEVSEGHVPAEQVRCLHEDDRVQILRQIAVNRAALEKSGKLSLVRSQMPPMFIWPMRQTPHFNYPGFYAISNYVDHDASSNVQDYNCGTRTYDGHRGTDIRIAPFRWKKMAEGDVQIIAAADGVIILKQDGNVDQSCVWGSGLPWNAVFVQHADGTVTWYGHMKLGSTTPKDSGDAVVAGEYLGLVGSSGNSTGPHLHFEVYDPGGNLIDPFQGTCNGLNTDTWWLNQLPYFDSGVNRLLTATQQWTSPPCPQQSQIFEEDVFNRGDPITLSVHYRNDIPLNSSQITAFEPDGDTSTMLNVVYQPPAFNTNGFAFYNRTIANDAPRGKWTFEVVHTTTSYGTATYQLEFWVPQACQPDINIAGTHTIDRYYQASNTITSTANVSVSTHIVYDAVISATLTPGFFAPVGSKLEIKTAGCN
jgi:hypothetical protein